MGGCIGDTVASIMVSKLSCIVLVVAIAAGCATSGGSALPDRPPTKPSFKVVFREGKAFAQENGRSWRIAEVDRHEMLWAPDGLKFAYLIQKSESKEHEPLYEVVIRNIRGDSVNSFSVYRPGRPTELDWVDDEHLCYRAPPDKTGGAYVIHSASDGEILTIHRGENFAWSPGKKRIAYITGNTKHQVVKVGSDQIWPRPRASSQGRIVSELVWSPNGEGLAFLELNNTRARLVVLLVIDDENGDLTWNLPKRAYSGANKLFWAKSKVLIGESTFKPRFAASWTRVQ